MSLLATLRISSLATLRHLFCLFLSSFFFFLSFYFVSCVLKVQNVVSVLSSLLDARFQSSQSTYLGTPNIINNISKFKLTGSWGNLVYSHLGFFRKSDCKHCKQFCLHRGHQKFPTSLPSSFCDLGWRARYRFKVDDNANSINKRNLRVICFSLIR